MYCAAHTQEFPLSAYVTGSDVKSIKRLLLSVCILFEQFSAILLQNPSETKQNFVIIKFIFFFLLYLIHI